MLGTNQFEKLALKIWVNQKLGSLIRARRQVATSNKDKTVSFRRSVALGSARLQKTFLFCSSKCYLIIYFHILWGNHSDPEQFSLKEAGLWTSSVQATQRSPCPSCETRITECQNRNWRNHPLPLLLLPRAVKWPEEEDTSRDPNSPSRSHCLVQLQREPFTQMRGSWPRVPLEDIRPFLETTLIVIPLGPEVVVASAGQRPEMLLNILQDSPPLCLHKDFSRSFKLFIFWLFPFYPGSVLRETSFTGQPSISQSLLLIALSALVFLYCDQQLPGLNLSFPCLVSYEAANMVLFSCLVSSLLAVPYNGHSNVGSGHLNNS